MDKRKTYKKADYERVYSVYRTTDYNLFKALDGNRAVKDGRVKRIKESIGKVGYIKNPIIVNEKFEVVDGQGRLEAFKQLKLPVEFIIAEGIGIEECRSMNIYQTNWNIKDYINSYANLGNDAYVYLKDLIKRYDFISQKAVSFALCSDPKTNNNNYISNGMFEATEASYNAAIECLEFIRECEPYILKIDGRIEFIEIALVFIYFNCPEADVEKIKYSFKNRYSMVNPIATQDQAFVELENLYNFRNKKKYAAFAVPYREWLRDNGRTGNKSKSTVNTQYRGKLS